MVKHIVMFRLKPDSPERVMLEFKEGISALPACIAEIRQIEVGININPREDWDMCLIGLFDTMEDVAAYSVRPEHLQVVSRLKPYLVGRSCVDFEVER